MLKDCAHVGNVLALTFHAAKLYCMVVGKLAHLTSCSMFLGDVQLRRVSSITYLGIHAGGGKKLSLNVDPIRQAFFSACNCIYSQARCLNELIHLSLQESYCLPILTYAIASLKLNNKQEDLLNASWNSVYRTIFHFNKWESVRSFICGLRRLDVHHLISSRRLQVFHRSRCSCNSLVVKMFCVFSLIILMMRSYYCLVPNHMQYHLS
jgi:hypothetical protein